MSDKTDYPVTPAIRVLREKKVDFEPFVFDYVEKGGTSHSAQILGVDEHAVVKTLIFETNEKKPLIVLMHGDYQVSTKNLARLLNVKSVAPAAPEKAQKLTGYLVGGTSPFGVKTRMPVYAESSIFDLPTIYLNGGKRGFLVKIAVADLEKAIEIKKIEVAVKD
jgi:Cys-tRNA(Pro) deacylase